MSTSEFTSSSGNTVLDKLIRVAVVCAFRGKRRVPVETMLNFLEKSFSFAPFEEEYNNMEENIFSIIHSGESESWFAYDDEEETLDFLIDIPSLVLPSSTFKHDVDWLSRTSALQVIAAFVKIGKMSAKKTLPVLNKMIEESKIPRYSVSVVSQSMKVVELLPKHVQDKIVKLCGKAWEEQLVAISMDLGRPYELHVVSQSSPLVDSSMIVKSEDLISITKKIVISNDRGGIEGTLHRFSFIRNTSSQIVGLTVRIGRAMVGYSNLFSDMIGKRILVLGKPNSGKTTFLRDLARQVAEKKKTLILDTWCEIGGFSNLPHNSIGNARRIQVRDPLTQHQLVIPAVHDHFPEVVIMDEILTPEDVSAIRSISQRNNSISFGMTMCGNMSLHSLQNNPLLCQVLGVDQSSMKITSNPLVDVVIQFEEVSGCPCYEWKIFQNLKECIPNILSKKALNVEVRKRENEKLITTQVTFQ